MMSIWKDLLLHGGYVATPLALRLVTQELVDPVAPTPGVGAPPETPPAPEPPQVRLPWARVTIDHLLLR